jgi:ankyrin repeat protein
MSKTPVLVGSHTQWQVSVDAHNIEQLKRSLEFGNVDVDQCLRRCIEIGDYDAVCCSLAHWPDTTDCVAKAARANRLDIVRLLVNHGANTSGALNSAIFGDSASCIEWLLANGHVTDAEVGAAFRRAIECSPIEIVKLFADAGAQLDRLPSGKQQSPLDWAAECGRVDVVRYFVDEKRHSIDPSILHTAVSHGCIDVVRFLHERGASIRGTLPLAVNCAAHAAESLVVELTDFLWECGAKLDFEDTSVFPGVILAIKLNRPKLARFLLESHIAAPLTEADLIVLATPFARSDLTTRNLVEELWYVTGLADGVSPLELAVAGQTEDHVLLVRALLNYGARVDSNKSILNKSILFFARWSEPMACLVLAAGAWTGVVNAPMIAHDDDWDRHLGFPDSCSAWPPMCFFWDPMCFFSGRCYFEAVAAMIERGVTITLECVLAAICSGRGYDSVDEALMSLCLLELLQPLSKEDTAKVVVAAVCNQLLLQALIDSGFADIENDKSLAKDLLPAVVRAGNLSRVRWLVDGGLADIKNDSELVMLADRNDVAVYLLENGAKAHFDAGDRFVAHGWWDAVCVMLRNGMIFFLPNDLFARAPSDHFHQLTQSLLRSSDAYAIVKGDSLLVACERGDAQITEQLLRRGANVFVRNEAGKSPIHVVRTVECLQLLLTAKADIHARTSLHETPLHCACSAGQRYGFAPNSVKVALIETGWFAAPPRVFNCYSDVVVALIEAGAGVNDTDANGRTPLHYAARCDCERAVEALLDAGARVNDLDTNGWSPLHFAAASGNQAVLRALVAAGAVVNARSSDVGTPLDACLQERFSCSTFL